MRLANCWRSCGYGKSMPHKVKKPRNVERELSTYEAFNEREKILSLYFRYSIKTLHKLGDIQDNFQFFRK